MLHGNNELMHGGDCVRRKDYKSPNFCRNQLLYC